MNLRDERYEELYRELFTPLFRYFIFRTKDPELTNDLVQTVFLKFMNHGYVDRDHDHNLKSLFTIARNALIDHWRVSGKRLHVSLESMGSETVSEMPGPEDDFHSSENVRIIQESMTVLTDVEEDIVMLRMTTALDYRDIAKLVGLSVDNTRQMYSRALKKLKTYLENKKLYG